MRGKLTMIAIAMVASFGILASTGATPAAASGGSPVNASHYGVSCTRTNGTVSFNPPLAIPGSKTGTEVFKLKAKLKGCTATPTGGGPAVTVKGGTISGSLSTAGNSCTNEANTGDNPALTGHVTIKWKTSPALSSGSSVVSINSAEFAIAGIDDPLQFQMPSSTSSTVTGSFAGSNGGINTVAQITSSETPAGLFEACLAHSGLKKIALTSGVFDLSGPPASISITPGNPTIGVTPAGCPQASCYNQGVFRAIGHFGRSSIDLTQLASWSFANTSAASTVPCDFGTLTFPPECVLGNSVTSTEMFASWGGVTGSTLLNVIPDLQITGDFSGGPQALPDATVGVPYDQTLTATGGLTPYTWTADQLSVDGLNLNPATGEITGTPTEAGSGNFFIQVTDSSTMTQEDIELFSLTINPGA